VPPLGLATGLFFRRQLVAHLRGTARIGEVFRIVAECDGRLAMGRAGIGLALHAALSAGTEPDDAIPPEVVAGLAGDGFDVCGRAPLRLTPALVAGAAAIVSFGPDIAAVGPASVSVALWHDMPAVSDNYATARDAIRGRVATLCTELTGPP